MCIIHTTLTVRQNILQYQLKCNIPPRRTRIQKQETVDRRVSDIVPQTCYDNYAGMINVGWITKQTRMTIYHRIGYRRGRDEH